MNKNTQYESFYIQRSKKKSFQSNCTLWCNTDSSSHIIPYHNDIDESVAWRFRKISNNLISL